MNKKIYLYIHTLYTVYMYTYKRIFSLYDYIKSIYTFCSSILA